MDSNVLLYAIMDDPRQRIARQVLDGSPVTSVQALNEFVSVARRELAFTPEQAAEASRSARGLFSTIHSLLPTDHDAALEISLSHRLQWWDSLLLAVALRIGATTFVSEDLQDGFIINESLRVTNPFR